MFDLGGIYYSLSHNKIAICVEVGNLKFAIDDFIHHYTSCEPCVRLDHEEVPQGIRELVAKLKE